MNTFLLFLTNVNRVPDRERFHAKDCTTAKSFDNMNFKNWNIPRDSFIFKYFLMYNV